VGIVKIRDRSYRTNKSKPVIRGKRRLRAVKPARKKVTFYIVASEITPSRGLVKMNKNVLTNKYVPVIKPQRGQESLSKNELELLRFIEKMMNTTDNRGKEWWEKYDREFEKYRFRI